MTNHRHSMIPAAAGLMLLFSGATTTAFAQASTPSPSKMPEHHVGMKDMPAMSSMMGTPHHVLAMAYSENLATFARALQAEANQSKTVNPDLARPVVAEMRRSFDQMRQHHQAQMTTMGDKPMGDKPMGGMMMGNKPMGGMLLGEKMKADKAKQPSSGAMQDMESHLAAFNEHLSALESAVSSGTLDSKAVSTHTAEILKLCAIMSPPKAEAKPHHDDTTGEHRPTR